MATFYRSGLLNCETYEDFKESVSKFYYSTLHEEVDGYYDVSEYSKVFKGFAENFAYHKDTDV
ncbi:hypothetical protein RG959_24405, partial [Domibacillus sp. 8LH]|uniref:hypothetical protein n=1 Tax=Domibacillus sp. 8LH TaxID=3073900 RepID=UPI0031732921